jgi:hypothetical protein
MWTEFFDSSLWSRTILQLSHAEPAIRHGVLALSAMHEQYDAVEPAAAGAFAAGAFAFAQYMRAVVCSKAMLRTYQGGRAGLEKVLVACIVFTCYENLAGNHRTASMHLHNGLRILEQSGQRERTAVAHLLLRFDLQAMTFSDDASRYMYKMECAPRCPAVRDSYVANDQARDDLVGLLRGMMWLAGMADEDPLATQHPVWVTLRREMLDAFKQWEARFATYLEGTGTRDPKAHAGNTLLQISALTFRIIMGSGAGTKSEMAWDSYVGEFRNIVELAEGMPRIRPAGATAAAAASKRPPASVSSQRLLAPNPATVATAPTAGEAAFHVFSHTPSPSPPPLAPRFSHLPSSFSPSFELSTIVPLFIVGCRCRDPLLRRRAIALLLSSRRREGVWDSLGAGMVALQCMTKEEGLPAHLSLNGDMMRRNPAIRECKDVREELRVKDIFVKVKMKEGKMDLVYSLTTGEEKRERHVLWDGKGGEVGVLWEALGEGTGLYA